MTDQMATDRLLRDHFASRVDASLVEGQAGRILERAGVVGQRPAWMIALRGTSVRAEAGFVPESRARRVAVLVAVGLLVLLTIALTIIGAERRNTPFGPGLLAISRDGAIVLVDATTGREQRVVVDDGLRFLDPSWSPGGRYVVFSEQEGMPYLLDVDAMDVRPLGDLENITWSPDGSTLAAGGEGVLRFVDGQTGEGRDVVLDMKPAARTYPYAWSPDGRWLAAGWDLSENGVGDLLVRVDVTSGDTFALIPFDGYTLGMDASWAPDSSRLAFTHVKCQELGHTAHSFHCPRALAIIGMDGTGLVDLTEYGPVASDPDWSPDGRWIAYGSRAQKELPTTDQTDSTTINALSIIRPDGTDSRVIADGVTRWAWAPDGATILYAMGSTVEPEENPIWQYDPATGSRRRMDISAEGFSWQPIVANAAAPALPTTGALIYEPPKPEIAPATPRPTAPADPSRSATGILFATDSEVVAHEFAANEPRRVSYLPIACRGGCSVAFAPDGSAILIAMDDPDYPMTRVIARDGTTMADLSGVERNAYSWSARGRFLFDQGGDGDRRPAILRPDGSGRTEIPGADPSAAVSNDPSAWWSADDTRLAVQDAAGQILVGSGDGSDLMPTGLMSTPGAPVSWSPDLERLTFVRDGNAWVAMADGTDSRALTAFDLGSVTDVAWSPNGRWIAVSRGTTLWIAAADGSGELRQLGVPDAARYRQVAWSPDGARIAVAGERSDAVTGSERTFIVSVDGGAVTVLDGADQPIWSPDGRFLAVTNTISEEASVDIVNADGSGRYSIPTGRSAVGLAKAWIP